MKRIFFLLFPAAIFAQDLSEIMRPKLEQIVPGAELTFARNIPTALESAIRAIASEEKWQPFFKDYSEKKSLETDVEAVAGRLKLTIAQRSRECREALFDGKSDFVFFLKKWLPHLQMLPEEMQGDFLSEVAERYLDVFPPDREGAIHFLVESVTFSLKKG
jgi:hypothetical protein